MKKLKPNVHMHESAENRQKRFCDEIKTDPLFIGDILEFGTGGGRDTVYFARQFPNKRIITFDGFQGFPSSKKPVINDCSKGRHNFDETAVRKALEPFKNIHTHKEMTSKLRSPKFYTVDKIAGVSFDMVLYEGTIDALNFCNKCNWKDLLTRFGKWFFEHEQAAFYEFIKEKKYEYKILFEKNYTIISIHR